MKGERQARNHLTKLHMRRINGNGSKLFVVCALPDYTHLFKLISYQNQIKIRIQHLFNHYSYFEQ